jgi:ankyrin repeat protein
MRCSHIRDLVVCVVVATTAIVNTTASGLSQESGKALERLQVLGIELQGDALAKAIATRQQRVVEWLLDAQVSPNVKDSMGMTPLLHAVVANDWKLAARLLAAGADPKECDPRGVSPLMIAAAAGHLETMDALLRQGADVNVTDAGGRSALHYAVAARKAPAMQKLLEKDTRVDGTTVDGRDPFSLAVETRDWTYMQPILERLESRVWDFHGRSALQQALTARDVNRMRLVMGKHSGPPTPEDCKDPLLAYAAVANDVELARLLLDAGADPNTAIEAPVEPRLLEYVPHKFLRHYLTDEPGMTVLAIAAGMGHEAMLRLLLEKGAERSRATRSKHKLVPLYFAAWGGHAECLQSLIGNAPKPEEMRIEVSLGAQQATLYKDGSPIYRTEISSGRSDFPTPTGRFVVTDKKTSHMSSIYRVKMPFFMRLSCRDFGMHEGHIPGYPASHGCIRLPSGSARKVFREVPIGTLVTINR